MCVISAGGGLPDWCYKGNSHSKLSNTRVQLHAALGVTCSS